MKNRLLLLLVLSTTFGFAQTETNGSFKSEIKIQVELNYILQKPDDTKELKPLIIFLHGSGAKGDEIEKIKADGPIKYSKTNKLDAFILVPQCPENKYWDSEELYQLINKIIKENKIDPSRIYLTGLSMGAWGCWNLAYAHPEMFAALLPIAGFVDRVPLIEGCKIKDIPIRIYHGLLDNVVDVEYSIKIYKKLKDCNKDIELEIFDDAWHDSWTRVYNNPATYEWMFKQKKKEQL